jgi:hypothetical protein
MIPFLVLAIVVTCTAPGRIPAGLVTHYAYGLTAETTYDVYRDGARVAASVQAGAGGTVVFAADGGGTFGFLPAGAPGDAVAPSAVTSLAVTATGFGTVSLSWAAPGDDGSAGTAFQYDLRYSIVPIDGETFTSATRVQGEAMPSASGSIEGFMVAGLAGGRTYYFALRTGDEVLNWSGLSNVASRP